MRFYMLQNRNEYLRAPLRDHAINEYSGQAVRSASTLAESGSDKDSFGDVVGKLDKRPVVDQGSFASPSATPSYGFISNPAQVYMVTMDPGPATTIFAESSQQHTCTVPPLPPHESIFATYGLPPHSIILESLAPPLHAELLGL